MMDCVVFDPDGGAFVALWALGGVQGAAWIALDDRFEGSLAALAPERVLLDLRRRGDAIGGIVRRARAALSHGRIVVLGPPGDLGAAEAAMRAGAWGYVTRERSLTAALDAIAGDRAYITWTGRQAIARRVGPGAR